MNLHLFIQDDLFTARKDQQDNAAMVGELVVFNGTKFVHFNIPDVIFTDIVMHGRTLVIHKKDVLV